MKIAVLNYEEPYFVLASTSLIKGLQKMQNSDVTFFVKDESLPLVKYNKNIKCISGFVSEQNDYDVLINYSVSAAALDFANNLKSQIKLGFIEKHGYLAFADKNAEELYNILHNRKKSQQSLIKTIYKVANIKWHGEGYCLSYFPRKKMIRTNTGVFVTNEHLREYLRNNLFLTRSHTQFMTNKKDLLKRIDEINSCMNIITDDLFVLHASIALRKYVQFLDRYDTNYQIEFFGNGNHNRVPDVYWTK